MSATEQAISSIMINSSEDPGMRMESRYSVIFGELQPAIAETSCGGKKKSLLCPRCNWWMICVPYQTHPHLPQVIHVFLTTEPNTGNTQKHPEKMRIFMGTLLVVIDRILHYTLLRDLHNQPHRGSSLLIEAYILSSSIALIATSLPVRVSNLFKQSVHSLGQNVLQFLKEENRIQCWKASSLGTWTYTWTWRVLTPDRHLQRILSPQFHSSHIAWLALSVTSKSWSSWSVGKKNEKQAVIWQALQHQSSEISPHSM